MPTPEEELRELRLEQQAFSIVEKWMSSKEYDYQGDAEAEIEKLMKLARALLKRRMDLFDALSKKATEVYERRKKLEAPA